MNKNNLYFYMIDTEKLEKLCKDKSHKLKKIEKNENFIIYIREDDGLWIFARTKVAPGQDKLINLKTTKKRIDAILEYAVTVRSSSTTYEFNNMFFAIHAADWGIKSNDLKKGCDAFVLQDIDKKAYKSTIQATKEFAEELKKKHDANECIVKVFSHTDNSDIHNKLFNSEPAKFFTPESQNQIFQPASAEQNTKGSSAPVNKISFDSFLKKSGAQISYMESLFFEFRLCLATLSALNSEENEESWKEMLGRMIFLLQGGDLVRSWVENLIVETDSKDNGKSLQENHYTEESHVLGIGHYVKLYHGDTLCLEKCIELLSNKSPDKNKLMDKLKEVETIVKDIFVSETEK